MEETVTFETKPPIPGNEYFARFLDVCSDDPCCHTNTEVSKNNRLIRLCTEDCHSQEIANGLINIDTSTDTRIHEWRFKILSTAKDSWSIRIGINESFSIPSYTVIRMKSTTKQNKSVLQSMFSAVQTEQTEQKQMYGWPKLSDTEKQKRKKYYSFGNNGKKYAHFMDGYEGEYGGIHYKTGDYISMKLDCLGKMDESGTKNVLLSITVNDTEKSKPYLIKKGKMYQMRVELWSYGTNDNYGASLVSMGPYYGGNDEIGDASLELIEYSHSYKRSDIDDNEEKKEAVKIKKNKKKKQKQTQKQKDKQMIKEKEEENVRLNKEIEKKNAKITSLEKRILNFEKENIRLSKENKKLNKKVGNKQSTKKIKSKVVEEEKKSNDTMVVIESVLNKLNAEYIIFKEMYNDKTLENIMNKTPEKLMNKQSSLNKQFNIYKQAVDGIAISSDTFNQYIQDIDGMIIKLSHPNTSNYVNWNVEQIMVWIKSLEDGRFNKYVDSLSNGFRESEINGADVPDIKSSDLSSSPFNIKNFRDKKDLVQHFTSLKKIENNEGVTAYI